MISLWYPCITTTHPFDPPPKDTHPPSNSPPKIHPPTHLQKNKNSAEATDIANAVLDGVDGILLGAETLRGKYSVITVNTILEIASQAEKVFDHTHHYEYLVSMKAIEDAAGEDESTSSEPDEASARVGGMWGMGMGWMRMGCFCCLFSVNHVCLVYCCCAYFIVCCCCACCYRVLLLLFY